MSNPSPARSIPSDAEGIIHVEYARACLEYTFESNRNEERRIQAVLYMTIGALGACRYLLTEISHYAVGLGPLVDVLRMATLGASLVLLAGLGIAIYGLRSTTFEPTSQMLPEWIATKMGSRQGEYLDGCLGQSESEILARMFTENHALAQAKVRRSRVYRLLSSIFIVGTLPMLLVFGTLLVSRSITFL